MSGYDEYLIDNTKWEVKRRYKNLFPAFKYLTICEAIDTELSRKVLIKKISRPFETEDDIKRTYREIITLKHMKHDNLTLLLDLFTREQTLEKFKDVYIVTAYMDMTLKDVIKTQKLNETQIQFFTYQILRGLKYLHSANIIHRDLKPSSLAVNLDLELRIQDFDFSRSKQNNMTGYVTTRWYRAPEILLLKQYDKLIDNWSLGCIVAELYIREPLFQGKDSAHQLKLIFETIGLPSEEYIKELDPKVQEHIDIIRNSLDVKPINILSRIGSYYGKDFINTLLKIDPKERSNTDKALTHMFVEQFHDPDDEPESDDFHEDNIENMTTAQLKENLEEQDPAACIE